MISKKSKNLSVEDIELGIMLNQINLDCDRSKYTDTISYYDGMGPALYRLCKFDNSIQVFTDSLIQDPLNVEIISNKGSALAKLGYNKEAILHFDRAIEINPDFLPAKNNKANVLAKIGDYDQAISLYAEILGENPNYLVARQNMEIALSEIPLTNNQEIPPTEITSLENNVINEISISETPKITNSSNEISDDFFEHLGSVFSSFGSLFGILDWFCYAQDVNKPIKPRVIDSL